MSEVAKIQAVQRSLAIAQKVNSQALAAAKKHRSASPSLAGGKKRRRSPSAGKGKPRKASPKRTHKRKSSPKRK